MRILILPLMLSAALLTCCAGLEALKDPPVAADSPLAGQTKALDAAPVGEPPKLSDVERLLANPPKIEGLEEKVDDLNTSGRDTNTDPWAAQPVGESTDDFVKAGRDRAGTQ